MQVSNLAVWQAKEPLQTLLSEPWPVKVAYGLAKLARKVSEQHAVIDQVRVGLIRQYGKAGDNGQLLVAPDCEGWGGFVKDFNELLTEQSELENVWKVTLPDSEIRVTPSVLLALDDFVEVA